jgi:hypothetical protein
MRAERPDHHEGGTDMIFPREFTYRLKRAFVEAHIQ